MLLTGRHVVISPIGCNVQTPVATATSVKHAILGGDLGASAPHPLGLDYTTVRILHRASGSNTSPHTPPRTHVHTHVQTLMHACMYARTHVFNSYSIHAGSFVCESCSFRELF